MIARRGFLAGMLALGAAPAIVRASSLMPIYVPRPIVRATPADLRAMARAHAASYMRKTVDAAFLGALRDSAVYGLGMTQMSVQAGHVIATHIPTNRIYLP